MTFRLLVGKCRITHFIHVYQKQIFKIPCEDHCMQLTTWTDVGGIKYYSTILMDHFSCINLKIMNCFVTMTSSLVDQMEGGTPLLAVKY